MFAILLGLENDSFLGVCLNRDSFCVDESGVCSRVFVGQVERISRELDTTTRLSLDEECVV